ncbi:MAG: hypothetical protein WD963_02360 [Candidatus Paceibacterota bacterium]
MKKFLVLLVLVVGSLYVASWLEIFEYTFGFWIIAGFLLLLDKDYDGRILGDDRNMILGAVIVLSFCVWAYKGVIGFLAG